MIEEQIDICFCPQRDPPTESVCGSCQAMEVSCELAVDHSDNIVEDAAQYMIQFHSVSKFEAALTSCSSPRHGEDNGSESPCTHVEDVRCSLEILPFPSLDDRVDVLLNELVPSSTNDTEALLSEQHPYERNAEHVDLGNEDFYGDISRPSLDVPWDIKV